MRKLDIVFDMDDVLWDLLGEWIRTLNETHGTSVTRNDITVWDMQQAFPTLSHDELYAPLKERDFWGRVKPLDDAAAYIDKLVDKGHSVYLCTATDYRNIAYKVELLKKYFPMIPLKRMITAYNKSMIACDVIVDDGAHNLQGENSRYKIVLDAPYNQTGFEEDGAFKFRAYNWNDIYRIIDRIANAY